MDTAFTRIPIATSIMVHVMSRPRRWIDVRSQHADRTRTLFVHYAPYISQHCATQLLSLTAMTSDTYTRTHRIVNDNDSIVSTRSFPLPLTRNVSNSPQRCGISQRISGPPSQSIGASAVIQVAHPRKRFAHRRYLSKTWIDNVNHLCMALPLP